MDILIITARLEGRPCGGQVVPRIADAGRVLGALPRSCFGWAGNGAIHLACL